MSEETLNAAVTRLLEFALSCAERRSELNDKPDAVRSDGDELALRAAKASIVLLENRRPDKKKSDTLPLQDPTKLCLIGDMAAAGGTAVESMTDLLTSRGHTVVGYARGYDLGDDRHDGLLEEALSLAAAADTVVLFLGTTAEWEARMGKKSCITLPAAQLALCDRLSRMEKTVIVVLSSRVDMDMSFVTAAVHPFAAVLLASLDVPNGLMAVAETLIGAHDPDGRLPVTLCARNTCPDLFREQRRIGPFVGYRYYDTLGYGALYPFGHGLSYTSFQYTDLKVENGWITFTVKNTGSRAGTETAQVYVGMGSSAVLRPRRELVGFARVELAPGQMQTVTLPLELPAVCTEEGRLLTEQGTYTLSVGASVSDIRLHTTLVAGQDILLPDGADPADYLPSVSNVHTQRYTMEAEYTPMKPSLRNLLFGIAALCLAVSLKLYDILTAADSVFLDIVAGILAVGAALFFAMEVRDRRKQNAADREAIEAANKALFADATAISVPSAAELFGDDLYMPAEPSEYEADSPGDDGEYDLLADVDKTLTFSEAARDLLALAQERGIVPDVAAVNGIFAALATSRLVVVRGMSDVQFSSLAALLGEYFSCPAAVDTVDATYRSEADVLFATDAYGGRTPRHLLNSIRAACREPGKIHLAALAGVEPAAMSDYFVPFVRHAHAPRSGRTVMAVNENGEDEVFRLPENLWFLLSLKEDAPLHALPDHVAEVATVNTWPMELMTPVEGHAELRHFGYGQMVYLCDRLRSRFAVDEDTWKRIDRLEAYAARFGEFRIGNKLWLGLEQYMAVLMSLDIGESAARDEAMAVKLLPALIPALAGRIPRDERGLSETLDAIFGDDDTTLCRQTIKESGADLI